MKDYLLVSYTGSGLAWLLNFLLENDVLIYHGRKIEDMWTINDSIYILKKEKEVFKQLLPILSEKKEYRFDNSVSVKCAHDFPNNNSFGKKIVLLVRDGRDTIYSQYKRENKVENFRDMLETDMPPFNLQPAQTWALLNKLWFDVTAKDSLFVIKFEDIKTNPFPVLKELLDFLKIKRTDENIRKGIASSSFERAKKAEEDYKKKDTNTLLFNIVNRKGKPGEWKETYSSPELTYFKGFPNKVLEMFGYESSGLLSEDEPSLEGLISKTNSLRKLKNQLKKNVKSTNDISKLLNFGSMLMCADWIENSYLDKKDSVEKIILYKAFIRASKAMLIENNFQLLIAKTLKEYGQRKKAMLIADHITTHCGNNKYFLMGIKEIYIHEKLTVILKRKIKKRLKIILPETWIIYVLQVRNILKQVIYKIRRNINLSRKN